MTNKKVYESYTPVKTGIAYKVFRIKNGKLYPPMVANKDKKDTPIGVWLDAEEGEFAGLSKTGRPQVKSIGSGTLAYRPGWHLGYVPRAEQFDRLNKETGEKEFPKDFVWAECEYAMDIDYQSEADEQGYVRTKRDDMGNVETYKSDKYQHSLAGLKKLPAQGYYRYRTNPNPSTVPWIITGQMKVNGLLDDFEVNKILKQKGISPIHRQGGDKTLKELGYDGKEALSNEPTSYLSLNEASYGLNNKKVSFSNMIKTLFKQSIIDKLMNTEIKAVNQLSDDELGSYPFNPVPFFTSISNKTGSKENNLLGLIKHHTLYPNETIDTTIQSHTRTHNQINTNLLKEVSEVLKDVYKNEYASLYKEKVTENYISKVYNFALFENCLRLMGNKLKALGINLNTLKQKYLSASSVNTNINESISELNSEKLSRLIAECEGIMKELGYDLPKDLCYRQMETTSRYGSAFYPTKEVGGKYTISLSKYLENDSDEAIKRTILHEMAHIVAIVEDIETERVVIRNGRAYLKWDTPSGHGPRWKAIVNRINAKTGLNITRTTPLQYHSGVEKAHNDKVKYIVRCNHCGHEYTYTRKTKFVQHCNDLINGKPTWTCGVCHKGANFEVIERK